MTNELQSKLFEYIPYIIIGLNALVSYKGFNDQSFITRYLFHPGSILIGKQYDRMVTSGFLHANWQHLIFNMLSFYFFYQVSLFYTGLWGFLAIYFGSLIGGNLLSLLINKDNSRYTALGASGAVSGIIFASVALKNVSIYMFFIPIPIPGWVYALLYTAYSIYGIKAKRDNIGHEAHLGGGVTGMLLATILAPEMALENIWIVIGVLVPTLVLIVIVWKFPHLLHGKSGSGWLKGKVQYYDADEEYNAIKKAKRDEVDRILDKINTYGIDSLTDDEKRFLDTNW